MRLLKIFVIISCIAVVITIANFLIFKSNEKVLVEVNGEKLYEKDIKLIEEMYKKKGQEIQRDKLIEAAISEMIVMQKGKEMQIVINYDDVDNAIAKLKVENKELYNIAIEQYGDEHTYREKLFNKYLYDATYNQIVNDIEIDKSSITKNLINDIAESENIDLSELNEEECRILYEDIFNKKNKEYKAEFFKRWINEQKKHVKIKYY